MDRSTVLQNTTKFALKSDLRTKGINHVKREKSSTMHAYIIFETFSGTHWSRPPEIDVNDFKGMPGYVGLLLEWRSFHFI